MELNEINELEEILKQFPFVTLKQSKQIINYLISYKSNSITQINKMISLIQKINMCKICSLYSLNDLCFICASDSRESKLLIINNVEQINKFEKDQLYDGKYYVIPILFTKKFKKINFDFKPLIDYLKNFDELIIGIDSTAEGILTSNLIYESIREYSSIKITKLATGIPLGSNINYIDEITLSYALKNRKDID